MIKNVMYHMLIYLLSISSLCNKTPGKSTLQWDNLQSFVLNFGVIGQPSCEYIWITMVSVVSEINAVVVSCIRSKIPSKHSSTAITAVINISPPHNG